MVTGKKMAGVSLTRYKNARKLVGVVRFGEKLGMGKAQASAYFGANPLKGIGHQVARRIEREFSLGEGGMDVDREMLQPSRPTDDRSFESRFMAAQADLSRAAKLVGYDPPPALSSALRTALYGHGLTLDGLIVILDALKRSK